MAADTETKEVETKDTVKLSKEAQSVMDMVEKMTVLELSELVKAMEEKFGVSAAAPVAMAAATPGAAAEPTAEEKSEYDVVLVGAGEQKIAVIKVVRELNQALGLVEAKNLVEQGEAVILAKAKKEAAEEAKKALETAGAKVELR
jgi:large subunit ribosomal protein L7/L12